VSILAAARADRAVLAGRSYAAVPWRWISARHRASGTTEHQTRRRVMPVDTQHRPTVVLVQGAPHLPDLISDTACASESANA
jgi:hypothetical protein